METQTATTALATVIEKDELLQHWQGHRGLSRRMIEAFPEDQLYTFSIGGMRTYAQLAMEMIAISAMGMRGIVFSDWSFNEPAIDFETLPPATKQELLQLWDLVTEHINTLWPQITAERFHEIESAWGMYEMPIYGHLLYAIDNEIHHRGQGYVYLRALGIEPPAFWDRH